MSAQELQSLQSTQPTTVQKPLGRLQLYLVELKTCMVLVRELLVEVKEVVVILAMIIFFVWGMIEVLNKLH